MNGRDDIALLSGEDEEWCQDTEPHSQVPNSYIRQTSANTQNDFRGDDFSTDSDENNTGIIQQEIEFGDFLEKHVGDSGRHQWVVALTLLLIDMADCMLMLAPVFVAAVPDFTCDASKYGSGFNCSQKESKDIFLPLEEHHGKTGQAQCQYYNGISVQNETSRQQCIQLNLTELRSTEGNCDAWDYNSTFYASTIVTEWNLVCSQSHLIAISTSVYWVGGIVGLLFGGHLADRWGRKPTAILGLIFELIFGLASAFSPNYWSFVVFRCLTSVFQIFRSVGVWIVCYEIFGDSNRIRGFVAENIGWGAGYYLMAGIAYYERRWRYILAYILVVDVVVFLLMIFYHTESPRWLLTRNKGRKAMKHLCLIARRNQKTIPSDIVPIVQEETQTVSGFQLLKWPATRKVTFVLFYLWFGMGLVYYGISMNTVDMGGNPFVNFVISGTVDLVSGLASLIILKKFGRVLPFAYGLLVGGIVLILSIAVPVEIQGMLFAVAMVGKFFTAIPGNCTWLYALEIYPTSIRSIGVHICSIMARIGAIVAPYLSILSHNSRALPLLVFGVTSLTGGLLAFILPETKDVALKQTVEEGESFMKKNICMTAPCARGGCCRRVRTQKYSNLNRSIPELDSDIENMQDDE